MAWFGLKTSISIFAFAVCLSGPAQALDRIDLFAIGASAEVRNRLTNASLLAQAARENVSDPEDILAAARAEYVRLIEALYAAGYYGPEISVRVDGREAANIPTFEEPGSISNVVVTVRPGPRFRFAQAEVGPLAPGTELPDDFRPGAVARTGTLVETAGAAVDAWEAVGFPKADVAGQNLAVRHQDAEMDAAIFVEPGPRLRFGTLRIEGNDKVKTSAVRRVIGWPEGAFVTPELQDRAAQRLRRSGAFRSVVLRESDRPNPDGTLDHALTLVEEKPRRFGFGGELSTEEGLSLSGFWLNRNITDDADRLRFDAEISGIGGQTGGIDYGVSVRYERPATFFTDTDLFTGLSYDRLREPEFSSDTFEAEAGLRRIVSDTLTLEGGIGLQTSRITDATGTGSFQLLTFPGRLTWSTRNDVLDPTAGHFIDAEVMPFIGFSDAGSGARLTVDARTYQSVDADDRFVLALRGQAGSVIGPDTASVPADLRFFSGGGGTVRGQPYQSLGVDFAGDLTGGLSFLAASAELRAAISDTIGVVGFADVGFVGETAMPGIDGSVHAGAGIGVRYNTGLGPIRLDLAVPVTESPAETLFIYVGIGQAF
ncbi:MAG: autotransporter assembly complex family protein [Pseudomonadota bacterium]